MVRAGVRLSRLPGLRRIPTYPAYSYPAYSYPAYETSTYSTYTPIYTAPGTTPTPQPLTAPPPGSAEAAPAPPGGAQQGAAQPPQASTQNCQNVWVEGHYETRVMPNGQRLTAWIPAYAQQVCQ